MLGALSLVAVGQEHDQRRALAPLVLGDYQEVVDDDLGPIDEVTELRFPGHQRVRRLDRVAVLKAQRGVLRKERIAYREESWPAHARERHVLCAIVVVDQRRVSMRKRTSTCVLTGQAYVRSILQQRSNRQRLAKGPVDVTALE